MIDDIRKFEKKEREDKQIYTHNVLAKLQFYNFFPKHSLVLIVGNMWCMSVL